MGAVTGGHMGEVSHVAPPPVLPDVAGHLAAGIESLDRVAVARISGADAQRRQRLGRGDPGGQAASGAGLPGPNADLHYEGTGEVAYGTKFVLVAVRSEEIRGRMILDLEWVADKGRRPRWPWVASPI